MQTRQPQETADNFTPNIPAMFHGAPGFANTKPNDGTPAGTGRLPWFFKSILLPIVLLIAFAAPAVAVERTANSNPNLHWTTRAQASHLESVTDMTFSPDGGVLLTVGLDSSAKLWHAETGRLLWERTVPGVYIERPVFSEDGRTVMATTATRGNHHPGFVVWETETGQSLSGEREWRKNLDSFSEIAISPNALIVAVAARDTIAMWDMDGSKKRFSFGAVTESIDAMEFTPNSRFLIVRFDDGSAGIWRHRHR